MVDRLTCSSNLYVVSSVDDLHPLLLVTFTACFKVNIVLLDSDEVSVRNTEVLAQGNSPRHMLHSSWN